MGRTGAVAFALAMLSTAPAAAQTFHLDDTLRGATTGNASGGSFAADGWTVTGPADRIWYALPRLASGYVEFTLANVTNATLPLPDHEIFAMYEDGYGIGEPIGYAPAFRGNAYKTLVRIYGMVEPSRVGAMKLMWGMCPSGAPGYDTCGCASFFEEPFASPGPWTGAPVRIRVEWGGGHSRLLRDGAEVVSVDWSGSGLEFGPSDLHMMLGSPRNDGSLSAMPLGSTFSDLVVDGTMGSLATCPGTTVPDAGPPVDAGVCTGGALADGTAASFDPGVHPDVTDLNVEGDGSGGTSAVVYLRFPAVPGPVTSATLTLDTSANPSAGGGSGQVCRVDGAVWDESTLTWATRPTVSAACSGGARTVGGSMPVTWDVTSLIVPGSDLTLAIVSTDGDGAHYLSKEAAGCSSGPRLDYVLAPLPDAGPGMDSGTVSPFDAGNAPHDAATLDAPATSDAGAHHGPVSGGCCNTTSTAPPPLALVALLLVAPFARRRRR